MELSEREKRQKEVYTKVADFLVEQLDEETGREGFVFDSEKLANTLESIAWLESEIDRFQDIEAFIPPEEQINVRDYLPVRRSVRKRRRLC
jgi:hypothetical protein